MELLWSQGNPFQTLLENRFSGRLVRDQTGLNPSDYSWGISAFGQAEAQARAATGPQRLLNRGSGLLNRLPAWVSLSVMHVLGSQLGIPLSELLSILHMTLLTLSSASLMLGQEDRGLTGSPSSSARGASVGWYGSAGDDATGGHSPTAVKKQGV